MTPDKHTTKLQEALSTAQTLAVQANHTEIKPSHLLLALLDQEGGLATPLLTRSATNVDLRGLIQAHLDRQPKVSGSAGGQYISSDLRELLAQADKEWTALKDE